MPFEHSVSHEKRKLALFGHPVAHSRSPLIHRYFAQQMRQSLDYELVDVDAQQFASALDHFEKKGGFGANVTLPLKSIAYARCHELGVQARLSGVVNTLTRYKEHYWRGDNTDGLGLVIDITERHRIDLRGRRLLVLGAGGAAQAVLPALLETGVAHITIVNRTPERADALADRFAQPARINTAYWDALHDIGAFDFILNATAAGHQGIQFNLPFSLASEHTLVYDMNYAAAAIDFLAWGKAVGCRYVVDGLGMLVEQAAESFNIWHGVRPQTEEIYTLSRQQMG
jgi:shikimate dehydrogenase